MNALGLAAPTDARAGDRVQVQHARPNASTPSQWLDIRARTYTHTLARWLFFIYIIYIACNKKDDFPHLTRDRGADCYDTHRLLHYTRDVHMQHCDSTDASLSNFFKSFKIESLRDNWVKGMKEGKERREGRRRKEKISKEVHEMIFMSPKRKGTRPFNDGLRCCVVRKWSHCGRTASATQMHTGVLVYIMRSLSFGERSPAPRFVGDVARSSAFFFFFFFTAATGVLGQVLRRQDANSG